MIRVHVRGLDGFMRDLEVAEDRLVDGIHTLTSELADDTARSARNKADRDKKSGDAMRSIRAAGPVVTAGVGVVYYGFADFGGRVGEGRRISRKYIKGGRYLYPSVGGLDVGRRAEETADDATKGLR